MEAILSHRRSGHFSGNSSGNSVQSSDTFQLAASGLALIAAGRTGMPRRREVMEE